MAYLLDTHVVLWLLSDPGRISVAVQATLADPQTALFLSAVSLWEIEIKSGLGKLDAPSDLLEQLRQVRIAELPLQFKHTRNLRALPSIHRDPFDRMLIAQAQSADLTLVTADPVIAQYPVRVLRV